MNVLLTGGSGFIGSHTAVELLNIGAKVIVVDNFSNSSMTVLRQVEKITGKSLVVYEMDVSNKNQLERVFQEQSIDCVIHFAGFKAVGESVTRPLIYYRNNIDSTLSLLELMIQYSVKNLIFSSSATVYGDSAKLPITEDMELVLGKSPYGNTKLMIEQMLRDLIVAEPDFTAVILRYFNPVGAHPSGLIGEMPNGVPNNLMPYITQVAAGMRSKLSVFGNSYNTKDGTGMRDYIHVVDLAKGHVSAVFYCMDHKGVEVFNLGTGKGHTVLEVIQTFEEQNRVAVPYQIVSRRPGDVGECFADVSKAGLIMNWHAERTLQEMCIDAWRWQKESIGFFAYN